METYNDKARYKVNLYGDLSQVVAVRIEYKFYDNEYELPIEDGNDFVLFELDSIDGNCKPLNSIDIRLNDRFGCPVRSYEAIRECEFYYTFMLVQEHIRCRIY